MKQARVFSVILMPQLGQYLVTLEEIDGIRLIPIWVGPSEGMAIASRLENQKFPRPLTHDLLSNMLKQCDIKVEKVIVTDIKENTFYAVISIVSNGRKMQVDSRPSDAIALAVRSNAPIFIRDIIFAKCPVIQKPITKDEVTDFKKRLKNIKPEDFFKE